MTEIDVKEARSTGGSVQTECEEGAATECEVREGSD